MLTTQWLMRMDTLLAAAQANQAQQQAVAAAQQPAPAPAAPAPILPPVGLDNAQLYQLMMNHQAAMAQQHQQLLYSVFLINNIRLYYYRCIIYNSFMSIC